MLVVDVDHTQDFPDGRPVTPKLIGVNDLWEVMLTQEPSQEGLRGFIRPPAKVRFGWGCGCRVQQ